MHGPGPGGLEILLTFLVFIVLIPIAFVGTPFVFGRLAARYKQKSTDKKMVRRAIIGAFIGEIMGGTVIGILDAYWGLGALAMVSAYPIGSLVGAVVAAQLWTG